MIACRRSERNTTVSRERRRTKRYRRKRKYREKRLDYSNHVISDFGIPLYYLSTAVQSAHILRSACLPNAGWEIESQATRRAAKSVGRDKKVRSYGHFDLMLVSITASFPLQSEVGTIWYKMTDDFVANSLSLLTAFISAHIVSILCQSHNFTIA